MLSFIVPAHDEELLIGATLRAFDAAGQECRVSETFAPQAAFGIRPARQHGIGKCHSSG